MIRTAVFALGASLVALGCGAASAQVITTNSASPAANLEAPPPEVDRVAGPALPPGIGREGVRIVRPAAMLFASFDTDHDGQITDAEIDAGAAISFAVADKNHDGAITGFEQSDWATLVGSGGDVLANPMQFDSDLDRSVTLAEFTSGLHRLADTLKKKGESVLAYADLVQPLQPPGGGAQASESGQPPPKGQKAKHASPS
jgi:hypothetical protein